MPKTKLKEDANLVDETKVDDVSEGEAPQSKTALISLATHKLAGASLDQIAFFVKSLEPLGSSGVPDGAAEKNKASIAAKGAISEDLAMLFGENEDLKENFKERLTTIFEAAVDIRVDEIRVGLEDQYQSDVEDAVSKIAGELAEEVSGFLEYAAGEFIKENEVAIDKSIKADIAENVLRGLHTLLDENFITVPEEKVDIADALSTEVEELQEERNSLIQSNIELGERLKKFEKQNAIAEQVVGMTDVQADKYLKLVENIAFDGDLDGFKRKLVVIKESNFVKSEPSGKTNLTIEESIIEDGAETNAITEAAPASSGNSEVDAVVAAMRRFNKR